MQIKSNTIGKLQKIRSGNVFDSPLIFIRELLQNSQRSKATNVEFSVLDDKMVIKDNGCGCRNPENVFTLDLSSWDSTSEGYGIGFWSILCVPNLKSVTVKSKTWCCSFDAIKLFEEGDLSVSRETIDMLHGFEVILESDYFINNYDEIKYSLSNIARYLPFATSLNGEAIIKGDIFSDFKPMSYCKEYDNRLFKAKFAISEHSYTEIKMYYDKRFVKNFTAVDNVDGVFEVKKDKITLKEPDRTSYTQDEKFSLLTTKIEECVKDLFLSYIKEYGIDNSSYLDAVECWLSVKDYEKYLVFDDDMILEIEEKPLKDSSSGVVSEDENQNVAEEKTSSEATEFNASDYQKKDIIKSQKFIAPIPMVTEKTDGIKLKDALKKLKNSVWCSKDDYSYYVDLIQKAKYKGLNVIIAKNVLYERALRKYGILNIRYLENAFSETFIQSDICLKTSKEEAFIQLLQPIIEEFNLPKDVFLIANLSIESSFVVHGDVIFKKKESNKKDNIVVYGLTDGRNIFLDRVALGLSRFNIKKGNLGVWELKALMSSVNTIAHELAHYLYKTTDNTPEHYNKEVAIQQEIISLYL